MEERGGRDALPWRVADHDDDSSARLPRGGLMRFHHKKREIDGEGCAKVTIEEKVCEPDSNQPSHLRCTVHRKVSRTCQHGEPV